MASTALSRPHGPASRSALQRADRERDRLRRRALSGAAVARGDGRRGQSVAVPFSARVQARWAGQPKRFLQYVTLARQEAAGRGCERARRRARRRPVGPEPAARSVRHLRGDDARRVQGARLPPGDPLGSARRPARPRAARGDRAGRLLAQLRWPRTPRRSTSSRASGRAPRWCGIRRPPRITCAVPSSWRNARASRCRSCCAAPTSRSRCGRRCCASRSAMS